jgi:hypothetical protein
MAQKVTVSVIEARGLLGKDADGLSDPYVEVKFNNVREVTRVAHKTLHPEWHQSFDFQLVGSQDLTLEVWDEDPSITDSHGNVHRDFLGRVTIHAKDLAKIGSTDSWYKLEKRSFRSHVSGELRLGITVDTGAGARPQSGMAHPSLLGQSKPDFIALTICEARNLMAPHSGSLNTLVEAQYAGQSKQTRLAYNSSNPVYNSRLEFQRTDAVADIDITVWNVIPERVDDASAPRELVGKARIKAKDVADLAGVMASWLPLEKGQFPFQSNSRGDIRIELQHADSPNAGRATPSSYSTESTFTKQGERPSYPSERYGGDVFQKYDRAEPLRSIPVSYEVSDSRPTFVRVEEQPALVAAANATATKLVVTIHEARGLMAKDKEGLSDPYVEVAYGVQTFKTRIVQRTIRPVWGEQFVFAKGSVHDDLELIVWDQDVDARDRFGKDFLGQVTISAADLQSMVAGEDRWLKLGKRSQRSTVSGEIRVGLTWSGANVPAGADRAAAAPARQKPLTDYPEVKKGYLLMYDEAQPGLGWRLLWMSLRGPLLYYSSAKFNDVQFTIGHDRRDYAEYVAPQSMSAYTYQLGDELPYSKTPMVNAPYPKFTRGPQTSPVTAVIDLTQFHSVDMQTPEQRPLLRDHAHDAELKILIKGMQNLKLKSDVGNAHLWEWFTALKANSIVTTRANHVDELLGKYPEKIRDKSMYMHLATEHSYRDPLYLQQGFQQPSVALDLYLADVGISQDIRTGKSLAKSYLDPSQGDWQLPSYDEPANWKHGQYPAMQRSF